MTQIERQISTARHRLWLNRWLAYACWCVAGAAGVFAVVVLVQRLYAAAMPLLLIGGLLAGVALLVSIIWSAVKRESSALAAVKLDEAAGLRERLSSGRYCIASQDPFARAVVADAERTAGSLSARQHIRLTTPRPLALTSGAIFVAALMFLVPAGLLKRGEATEVGPSSVEFQQTKVAVKRKMDQVRQMLEGNPALDDLQMDLEGLDKNLGGQLKRPGDIRHIAAKKIDTLQDAIKRKQQSDKYGVVNEMRKLMRGLKVPDKSDAPAQKLTRALAQGDFKTAQEQVKALQEQLATLKSEQDKELVAKMSRQLSDLAKQLERLASSERIARKLQQAGLSKEDVERLLENLKKKDLDQLKKQLQEKGWNQQQIQKLAKQLQQQQQSGVVAKKLAQAMKQASQGASSGQMGDAMAGLSMAGGQLSELEQLEQEMNQLDSTLADLQEVKNDMEKPCSHCSGTGMQGDRLCGQ